MRQPVGRRAQQDPGEVRAEAIMRIADGQLAVRPATGSLGQRLLTLDVTESHLDGEMAGCSE